MQLMFVFYAVPRGSSRPCLLLPAVVAGDRKTATARLAQAIAEIQTAGLRARRAVRHRFLRHRVFWCSSLLALWALSALPDLGDCRAATILFLERPSASAISLSELRLADRGRASGLINTMVFTHFAVEHPAGIGALSPPDLPIAIAPAVGRAGAPVANGCAEPATSLRPWRWFAPEEAARAAASVTAVPKTFAWAAGSLDLRFIC